MSYIETIWKSGCAGSVAINDMLPIVPSQIYSLYEVYIAIEQGTVYQAREEQVFPALNMQSGDNIIIVNDHEKPYKTLSDLGWQALDALGNSLNNSSFSLVLWAICNPGKTSRVMLNLPLGSYNFYFPEKAIADHKHYSVYDIPKEFASVGFFIARFTFTYKYKAWVLYNTEDLRGKVLPFMF